MTCDQSNGMSYTKVMRVLLAEDDRKIASFILKGLREEGYLVEHAIDGELALSLALADTSSPFDLMIFDVMLPRRDGLSLCRELRTRGFHAPVLLLTALDGVDDRVRGLDSGADDYLVKPFDFPELLARLRALSRRMPHAVSTTLLQVEDLILDVNKRVANRNGQSIDLSTREFHLLEYLMRSAGRAVGRTVLLQTVWGFDFDGASNVVDVYVGYLRKKIDALGAPLIHTVRGVGYKIAEAEPKV